MKFRCKNLLVTGGCGFIGSNFINYILNTYQDLRIYNLDKLTYAGNLKNTASFNKNINYTFIKGDICDEILLKNIFKEYKIDGVINFAAETHVDNSIKKPGIFINSNINGVFNILNTCYKFWMKGPFSYKKSFKYSRFHQISTDEVYGSITDGSFTEKSPYKPNSPYSSSKASADMIVRSFNKTYGLNTTISISSNNFGKNQNKEKLLPKIVKCIKNDEKISIFGDGLNERDWIFVRDNCRAINLIYQDGNSGEKYNVGSGKSISNIELVKHILDLVSKDDMIKFSKIYQ